MTPLLHRFDGMVVFWSDWMAGMAWQVVALGAVVWVVASMGRRLPAGGRYLLWLLVFVKLAVPPGIASPWGLGNVVSAYEVRVTRVNMPVPPPSASSYAPAIKPPPTAGSAPDASPMAAVPKVASFLFAGWLAVALLIFGGPLGQYLLHKRKIMASLSHPGGEALEVLEEERRRLGVKARVSLFASDKLSSPAVFGLLRPKIMLPPRDVIRSEDLRAVLAHELAHIKRHDIATGWAAVLLTCLYWFHPAVWLAHLYLRREREMACDDMVIRSRGIDGADYASTILSVAQRCKCRAPAGAGSLGILEHSDNLMARVRSCADGSRARKIGLKTAVLLLAVILAAPMGRWGRAAATDAEPAEEPPVVVATYPESGASDVDPELAEIRVTFDRKMNPGGYSWTGGGEIFPEVTGTPAWVDDRTCVLPVKLHEGRFYRVGINSQSHNNFRDADGTPARPTAIFFTTRGASEALIAALKPPRIVSMTPANGATIAPGVVEAAVTFDQPMCGGMSWTTAGGPEKFPEMLARPEWQPDKKTITASIKVEPNSEYVIGLNSPDHINFSSERNVPMAPVVWKFRTSNRPSE